MKLVFAEQAWEDYQHWIDTNPKIRARTNDSIKQCQRTLFESVGKPGSLRGDLKGWWSRRITQVHRMVYRVVGAASRQHLEIAQIRFHY